MDKPIEAPSIEKIEAAAQVLDDWQLHYYQLLYFQSPRLTSPGKPGYPFTVRIHPDHGLCMQFTPEKAPEYGFKVPVYRQKDQAACDAEILRKCQLILTAINEGRQKADSRMCCGLAERRGCVCNFSYTCELHGTQCIGSHD